MTLGGIQGQLAKLSAREAEVARLIVQGEKTGTIATILAITPTTVAIHLGNAKKKLGFDSTHAMVAWLATQFMREKIDTLADAIARSTIIDRDWLAAAIRDHFAGREIRPRVDHAA